LKKFFTGISRFTGRHSRLFAALGISLLFIIYQSNARFIAGSDVYPARFVPISLVTEFNYDMDEFLFLRNNDPKNWAPGAKYYPVSPGKPYSDKCISNSPTLIATLLAPFYIIPFGIMKISPQHYLVFYMDKMFASLFAAFSALFLFYALRQKRSPRGASLLIAIAYALGTGTWVHSSQSLWQHGPSQCFLALSLWLWLRSHRYNKGYFWCGLAVGIAVAARPSNSLWAMMLFADILLLRHGRRLLRIIRAVLVNAARNREGRAYRCLRLLLAHERPIFYYILGGLPSFLFVAIYNWSYFGAPWVTAYNFLGTGLESTLKWKRMPAGILGILFSPSLGLFPNAPFYLFLPVSIWIALWRPLGAPRRHVILPILFIGANIILYSSRIHGWWGGWSYTYRYLTDILPFFSFLLFALWRVRIPFTRKAKSKIIPYLYFIYRFSLWSVFGLMALWGIAVQAFGAFIWSGQFYYQWKEINQPLVIDFKNHAPGTIFDKPSPLWSLDEKKHLIRSELRYFKWDWANIKKNSKKWVTTPKKVYNDLFVKKHIKYGRYAPIILGIGEP